MNIRMHKKAHSNNRQHCWTTYIVKSIFFKLFNTDVKSLTRICGTALPLPFDGTR